MTDARYLPSRTAAPPFGRTARYTQLRRSSSAETAGVVQSSVPNIETSIGTRANSSHAQSPSHNGSECRASAFTVKTTRPMINTGKTASTHHHSMRCQVKARFHSNRNTAPTLPITIHLGAFSSEN